VEARHGASPLSRLEPLLEPLSSSETRVLRYLPTNLSAPEIARELSVSPNTVKTHIRHLYAKFGTHQRAEAVELAPRPRPARPLQNGCGQPLGASGSPAFIGPTAEVLVQESRGAGRPVPCQNSRIGADLAFRC
jgi:DNA-binding CsgD family transcriptional regulator